MRFPYDTSYCDAQKLLRYRSHWLSYGALIAALIAAPWVLPAFYVGELNYLYIVCIASLGLMILTGYTGQVSLGHAAFMAIGAYAHTWFLNHGFGFPASLACASALTGLVGLIIGLPAIRVSGLYLAMVTLACALVTEQIIGRWKDVTGGYSGISVPEPVIFGFNFGSLRAFYFLCLVILVAVLLALLNLTRGRTGRAFVGIRDSEAAAHTLGIWVGGYKVLAFIISAFVMGIAGALLAHHLQFLTPDAFSLALSIELVLMVVIGGLGSLRGAIFGAVLIGMLPTLISKIKPVLPASLSAQFGLETFVFGLILALFVMFEPTGLNGRWLKLKIFFANFPLYRRNTFRRGKAYMHSERYR
jgi:branched-chain amino acid transport system permease protein